MRILLVEDETELAKRVAANLSRHGLTCEWLANAEDALAFARDGFSVLVVDIGLPGMSGYDVARHSRAGGYPGQMIALTGYGQDQDKRQALAAGFDRHLLKPVSSDELLRIIDEA